MYILHSDAEAQAIAYHDGMYDLRLNSTSGGASPGSGVAPQRRSDYIDRKYALLRVRISFSVALIYQTPPPQPKILPALLNQTHPAPN